MNTSAKHLLAIFWMLSMMGPALGQNSIRIESKFEPAAITLSRNSTYKVTIHGSQQSPEGSLPQVNGLNLSQSPRIFRSASFINGVPSVKLEISFAVKPKRVGAFTLPAWSLTIGGQAYRVPATNLRVLPPSEEDILREEARKKQEADFRQALFLELSLPQDTLFVGQTILGSFEIFGLFPSKDVVGSSFLHGFSRIRQLEIPKISRRRQATPLPYCSLAKFLGRQKLELLAPP